LDAASMTPDRAEGGSGGPRAHSEEGVVATAAAAAGHATALADMPAKIYRAL